MRGWCTGGGSVVQEECVMLSWRCDVPRSGAQEGERTQANETTPQDGVHRLSLRVDKFFFENGGRPSWGAQLCSCLVLLFSSFSPAACRGRDVRRGTHYGDCGETRGTGTCFIEKFGGKDDGFAGGIERRTAEIYNTCTKELYDDYQTLSQLLYGVR